MIVAVPKLRHIDTGIVKNNEVGYIPRVGVLMSTYNGERYLREQIESIAAQEAVDIVLFVRDDGSRDKTGELLSELSQKPYGCISTWKVEMGNNLGFLGSFEELLSGAMGCEFYAFSDQDDYWFPEKLRIAVWALNATNASLYASTVEIADENLNPIGRNEFPGLSYSIPAEIIRHRLPGHNMVWTDSLQQQLRGFGPLPCWSHDQHVVVAGLLSGGELVFDRASYVLHRRLYDSVTPGGAGLSKRICHELRMLWNPGRAWDRSALAKSILAIPNARVSESDRGFLTKCAEHELLALVSDEAFDCGLPVGNIEAVISVLLGRF